MDAQVDEFVGRWYQAQQVPDANEQSESLRQAIQRTPGVRRLAGNPLLLTMIALIHQGERRLPRARGEIYEKCIEMLLRTWLEAKYDDEEIAARRRMREDLDLTTQKDYLAHLALAIQTKERGGEEEVRGLMHRKQVLEVLTQRHLVRGRRADPGLNHGRAQETMERFLEYLCDPVGLLIDRGGEQFSFLHLSFQEYLAAWQYSREDAPRHVAFFLQHLGDPAWEEVVLLRAYLLSQQGGTALDEVVAALLGRLGGGLGQWFLGLFRKPWPADRVRRGYLTLARALRDDLSFQRQDVDRILRAVFSGWEEEKNFSSAWFVALEEIVLFARGLSRERLEALLLEEVAGAAPARAGAYLHLYGRLFGKVPLAEVAKRADQEALLPAVVREEGRHA